MLSNENTKNIVFSIIRVSVFEVGKAVFYRTIMRTSLKTSKIIKIHKLGFRLVELINSDNMLLNPP